MLNKNNYNYCLTTSLCPFVYALYTQGLFNKLAKRQRVVHSTESVKYPDLLTMCTCSANKYAKYIAFMFVTGGGGAGFWKQTAKFDF